MPGSHADSTGFGCDFIFRNTKCESSFHSVTAPEYEGEGRHKAEEAGGGAGAEPRGRRRRAGPQPVRQVHRDLDQPTGVNIEIRNLTTLTG